MDIQQLNRILTETRKDIVQGSISNALKAMWALLQPVHNGYLNDRLWQQKEAYENILKYAFDYPNDPKRDEIYRKMQTELFEISDLLEQETIVHLGSTLGPSQKESLPTRKFGQTPKTLTSLWTTYLLKKNWKICSIALGPMPVKMQKTIIMSKSSSFLSSSF
ncbi:MAG: hypothetical protein HC896_07390 [Bacteroidales bacterium]|nr:hypothetical protein [Bacteroidales bacterium]